MLVRQLGLSIKQLSRAQVSVQSTNRSIAFLRVSRAKVQLASPVQANIETIRSCLEYCIGPLGPERPHVGKWKPVLRGNGRASNSDCTGPFVHHTVCTSYRPKARQFVQDRMVPPKFGDGAGCASFVGFDSSSLTDDCTPE
jgi:hypothetical protein